MGLKGPLINGHSLGCLTTQWKELRPGPSFFFIQCDSEESQRSLLVLMDGLENNSGGKSSLSVCNYIQPLLKSFTSQNQLRILSSVWTNGINSVDKTKERVVSSNQNWIKIFLFQVWREECSREGKICIGSDDRASPDHWLNISSSQTSFLQNPASQCEEFNLLEGGSHPCPSLPLDKIYKVYGGDFHQQGNS